MPIKPGGSDTSMHGMRLERRELLSYWKTDAGLTEKFAKISRNKLKYVNDLGVWRYWDGNRWAIDNKNRHRFEIRKLGLLQLKLSEGAEDEITKLQYQKEAKRVLSAKGIDNIAKLSRDEPLLSRTSEEFDANPKDINVIDSIIHIDNGVSVRPSNKLEYHTQLASTKFDVTATCPEWDAFLLSIFKNDKDLISYIQRAVGYSATACMSEHALFIMYGDGANGKSTFCRAIQDVLGDYYTVLNYESLTTKRGAIRNDIASLLGKRMVVAHEGPEGSRLHEGIVKDFTGNDLQKARFLYKENFTFKPTGKLWLSTNHKPEIRGTDIGIWRRVKLVPFLATFDGNKGPRPDLHMSDKLRGERAGILNWIIEGAIQWEANGLGSARSIRIATNKYRHDSDIVGKFIEDRYALDPNGTVSAESLYSDYKEWCESNGEEKMSRTSMGAYFTRQGFKRVRCPSGPSRGRMIYKGLVRVTGLRWENADVTDAANKVR